ncbi:MAG: hypothetical protein Sv326_0151 [Candidatus Fermentimicrarchaeum limneticum]|uniref:Zinc metalloprotease n=1 Tax=Fermentimicrarchaeum limneticum TaxID=2795018 RepID=A0A7D5XKU6_FERL1|nr:MAG: hypothetical protein Sv326_0151 [Candidatus Fermentimicrarchaeum limneticum]
MAFSINFKLIGIEIELHWSFLLLLLLIFLSAGIDAVLSISILFTFVVLHELSHSYVAMRNGVEVRKITLFPIGGMAMIDDVSIPPEVEFRMAIAGPLFNFVVVAAALLVSLFINVEPVKSLLSLVIEANLVLGLFNLLPAIPLDGGRVWRSLRERKVGHLRATIDAVKLSRFIIAMLLLASAIIAFVYDAFGFLIWNSIIAAVIYIGSGSELNVAVIKSSAKGLSVRDAANFSVVLLEPHLTLKDAFSVMQLNKLTALVVSSNPLRILNYRQLSTIEKGRWGKIRVVDVAQPSPACAIDEPLLDAWKKMRSAELSLLPVVSNGAIVGTIEEMDIEKLIVLNRLLRWE